MTYTVSPIDKVRATLEMKAAHEMRNPGVIYPELEGFVDKLFDAYDDGEFHKLSYFHNQLAKLIDESEED